jgi:hypothetical protein
MTPQKRTPRYQWECEMITAFHDEQWKELLDPLYEKFQAWKAGALSADDVNEALNKSYRDRRDLDRLFYEKHDWLARLIPLNEDWYPRWVKNHPRPAGIQE